MPLESAQEDLDQEFYHLLKYNEAILRICPINLLVTDPAHRIKLVNDYCRQYFRLETDAYENLPVTQLVQSPSAEVTRLLAPQEASRTSQTFYQAPLTINAVRIIGNIKTFPIYDGTFLIGRIIIIEDMTEYDHIQKQLFLSEKTRLGRSFRPQAWPMNQLPLRNSLYAFGLYEISVSY